MLKFFKIWTPMAAILENGRHIGISGGQHFFLKIYYPANIYAKFHACIIKWTIVWVICSTIRSSGLEVVSTTSQTIKDLCRQKRQNNQNSSAGVYAIPCGGCNKHYVGETSRDLHTRLTEHKTACRTHQTSNACVIHRDLHAHIMNWDLSRMIINETDNYRRKCFESAVIQSLDTIEQNRGMFNLAAPLTKLILHKHKHKLPTNAVPTQPP